MNPWRGAGPELIIAGIAYLATGLAGFAVAGAPGLAIVTVVAAALALAGMRLLLAQHDAEDIRALRDKPTAKSISGYSRRRFVVAHASETIGFYESDVRPVLEHILAARLAERHHTNLYASQEAARLRLGDDLWYWIDPARAVERAGRSRGIPPRTLARLIDRLERL